MHPADLAWISYLTIAEYKKIKNDYPEYIEALENNSVIEDNNVLVTYTKLGIPMKGSEFIKKYLLNLIDTVSGLNPKLIYLSQNDVHETISRVSQQRLSPDKAKWDDWIDLVIKYVESSKYGISNNLKGFDGVIKFFEDRKKIEFSLLNSLDTYCTVIPNENFNWGDVFEKLKKSL